jgi:hypothetical protein
MDWTKGLKATGSLANAWATYETAKEANKVAKDRLAYDKKKDALQQQKLGQAQVEFSDGFNTVFDGDTQKKKKKANSLADAYVSPENVAV